MNKLLNRIEYLLPNLKVEGCAHPVLKNFSVTRPENSGGAENSTENSGPHAKNFFCSMYESSLRHPVWVPEINVKPCNSVSRITRPQESLVLYKSFNALCCTYDSITEARQASMRPKYDKPKKYRDSYVTFSAFDANNNIIIIINHFRFWNLY